MNCAVTLDARDVRLLEDVLNYLVTEDDREKQDFIENHQYAETWFNEYDVLDVDAVPEEARSHIYYKAEKLRQDLMDVTHGS